MPGLDVHVVRNDESNGDELPVPALAPAAVVEVARLAQFVPQPGFHAPDRLRPRPRQAGAPSRAALEADPDVLGCSPLRQDPSGSQVFFAGVSSPTSSRYKRRPRIVHHHQASPAYSRGRAGCGWYGHGGRDWPHPPAVSASSSCRRSAISQRACLPAARSQPAFAVGKQQRLGDDAVAAPSPLRHSLPERRAVVRAGRSYGVFGSCRTGVGADHTL
jgi:hypothetical protein